LAPLIGQIASLFKITVAPGGHTPRPLRPARPAKVVRGKSPATSQTTPVAVSAPVEPPSTSASSA
ncbi:MAG: hypothetical protein AAB327_08085, partial [Actinomycetota bacterium]